MKKIKIILVIILVLEVGVIMLNKINQSFEHLPVEKIKGSMVYDMSTKEKSIGAVDNVFVAKINNIIKTVYDENDIPSTIYEIEVIENIKGNLPSNKTIELTQKGGLNKDQKSYTFYENAYLLEEGQEYIILAFVPFNNGDLVIHNEYTYKKLDNNSISKKNSINIVDQYKEAYKN
ncbi:MAG TPA: hypothetical protein IAC02_08990, partial [Candidatus Coprovivens excrementavium]|nr:hypothetical protein [Candidatus Coprovivens excrementavium]